MWSTIISWFSYIFTNDCDENSDDDSKDNFLADQLLDLEAAEKQDMYSNDKVEVPTNAVCFKKTGVITYLHDNYVLIDGMLYFDRSVCSLNLQVNDQILYLGYKDSNESIVVVRILENKGLFWGEVDDAEENNYEVTEHVLIGEVDYRHDRYVYIKKSDLKFNLDDVEGTFIPIKGDWLELKCKIQLDKSNLSDISMNQVLSVTAFKPLRIKTKSVYITEWTGTNGTCDRIIYFDNSSLIHGLEPKVGSKVMMEAIESNQGMFSWRALNMIELDRSSNEKENEYKLVEDEATLKLEREREIEMTYPLKFQNICFNQSSKILLNIKNNSRNSYVLNKYIILSKKKDSQIKIEPLLAQPKILHPHQSICLTITAYPKFLGNTKEGLIILFKDFKLKRFIEINVVEEQQSLTYFSSQNNYKTQYEKCESMRKIRKNGKFPVPGVTPIKPPAFIAVRLGIFPIPEKIWDIILGDSNQTGYSNNKEYTNILAHIETNLSCLSQELNINNYIDRWHTLLFMEEIQININIRVYDMPKVFLIRCHEYLGVEISGLSERRPSLVIGDSAIVKNLWDCHTPEYEGYIHCINGDLVLMKFNPQFHESYGGSDVAIEFHFNRASFRRCHQAINYAVPNLGPNILFPSKVKLRSSQMSKMKLQTMQWYNNDLNEDQKAAVTNILIGECRPMPYCIFGPPGTGKTVTVVETILQILTSIPESRILVATPSNSASNLITELLIKYQNRVKGSIVRLIASYLVDSDSLPDNIKPFCATLNIDNQVKSPLKPILKKGTNIDCQNSLIGRHRVTIGTCNCLGALAQIGLPNGHFTHIIIDEAGQATEPEAMIPMTFIDKENGQIILAGDPMQLGPVVISNYCREFNMDQSYMSRILECFPYQRDYVAFKNGYDNRFVTKLNNNYRSLEEVIALPSEMFYNSSLVAKMDRNQRWIIKIINAITDIFYCNDQIGGIFVNGIKGYNVKAKDSPSWYNPQEASMVAMTACKLLKKSISVDEIGIITPYIAQVRYLRLLFNSMGLPQPKIGTVEEFQGQERPIILISSVRSTESLIDKDMKHSLGFVSNPKRLNVAITRARVSVILFCNPHLLCVDPLWKRIIVNAVKQDKYMGCDLPTYITKESNSPVETDLL